MPYGNDPDQIRRNMRGLRAQIAAMRASNDDDEDTQARENLQAEVAALKERRIHVRHNAVALPALVIGGSDQTITWSTPLPTADYDVQVSTSPGLIGKATVAVKAGTQSATGVTLRVTATSFVSSGGTLSVLALWQG